MTYDSSYGWMTSCKAIYLAQRARPPHSCILISDSIHTLLDSSLAIKVAPPRVM